MIGQFGVVTAELARREAIIMLGSVRGADGDPAALRDANPSINNDEGTGRALSERVSQAEYRRSVELFLNPFFAKQRVRSVTTADVAELHGSLSHIPYQANRTLGVLSKMMNLAETWGMRDRRSNPCEDIVVDGAQNRDAAWYYPDPKPAAKNISGKIAFWKGVRIET
jgi:hypothetical protein